MKKLLFLIVGVLAAFASYSQNATVISAREIKAYPIVSALSGDTAAIAANNGHLWYDFVDHKWRAIIDGVAVTVSPISSSGSGSVTNIATTSPITGGPITTTGTIAIDNAAADGTTKGAASFTATDFNSSSGIISTDYTNGQASSGSTKGFLTSADWTTFNSKESTLSFSSPLSRSTNTISIPASSGSQNGYLSSTDWTTFNGKISSQWITTGSDLYYSTGNVMVGTSAAPTSKFHIVETSTSTSRGIQADQYNTGTQGSRITMRKARGTFGSPTTIITGDVLGSWTTSGHDGTNFVESGKVLSTSAGTISTGIVPSKMDFQTANASGTLTTGISINESQALTFPAYTTNGGIHYNNGSGVLAQTGAGTSTQLLHGGTSPAYSAVSLTADVTGTLPIANGGTGSTSQNWWGLSGTSTLTGSSTITSNTASQHNFSGTWTASANNQFHLSFAPSITARGTTSDRLTAASFTPTLVAGANSQILVANDINATFTNGAFTSVSNYGLRVASGGVLIGSTSAATDAVKLNILAGGTSSTDFALRVADGSDNPAVRIASTSKIEFGGTGGSARGIGIGTSGSVFSNTGSIMVYAGTLNSTGRTAHFFSNNGNTTTDNTSGSNDIFVRQSGNFSQSSGTTTFTAMLIDPTITQTSTASGVIRSLDIDQTGTILGTNYGITVRNTSSRNGFGIATPVSILESGGSFGAKVTSTSADITLDISNYTVLVDASGANRTITLPAASGCTDRIYTVKKIDSSGNSVTIDGNASETIDGSTTKVVNVQWSGYQIHCNGTSWFIIATF